MHEIRGRVGHKTEHVIVSNDVALHCGRNVLFLLSDFVSFQEELLLTLSHQLIWEGDPDMLLELDKDLEQLFSKDSQVLLL
jgi:hypothetical protein